MSQVNIAAEAIRIRLRMHQENLARGEQSLRQIEQAKAVTERLMEDDRTAVEYYTQQLQLAAPQPLPMAPQPYPQVALPQQQMAAVPPGYMLVPVQPQTVQLPETRQSTSATTVIDRPNPQDRPVMLGPAGAGVLATHGSAQDVAFGAGVFGGVSTNGAGMAAEDL